jgi:hypothetical protein
MVKHKHQKKLNYVQKRGKSMGYAGLPVVHRPGGVRADDGEFVRTKVGQSAPELLFILQQEEQRIESLNSSLNYKTLKPT